MKRLISILMVLFLALAGAANARTWLINATGTGDAPTIQAGVDSAAAADTVLLADGMYMGEGNRDIDFNGNDIVVASQSGNTSACIINCQGSSMNPHRGFTYDNNETSASVLENISILSGYMSSGGAVACHYSSPTINGCTFAGNTATIAGGAIDMVQSSAAISYCTFTGNTALNGGGAMYIESSPVTVTGCTLVANSAAVWGGAISCSGNSPVFTGCYFWENTAESGGGINMEGDCTASFTSCTFWHNQATDTGGGIRCAGASPTVNNCTFAADSSGNFGAAIQLAPGDAPGLSNTLIAFSKTGSAIHCFDPAGSIGLMCCNIYGNEGGDWTGCLAVHAGINGNISADPLFCDFPTGNVTMEECSPCLAANNGCGVNIGSFAGGCGCGEATEPTTWGGIKARYK
jgi:predicted outer membrane repeat protein